MYSIGGASAQKNKGTWHIQAATKGFTIVELLIVIIVIAILAALVITSYNGIVTQANNSQTVSAVQAYKKALILYAQEKGEYPKRFSSATVHGTTCLGDNYVGGVCWNGGPSISTYFSDQLKPYLGGSVPMPSTQPVMNSTTSYIGAIFSVGTGVTLDGAPHSFFLLYGLSGGSGTKCPVGPVLTIVGSGAYSSTPPASGSTGAWSAGVNCTISLPDPTKL